VLLKNKLLKTCFLGCLLAPLAWPSAGAAGGEATILFPVADIAAWSEKSFKGKTRYSIEQSEGKSVLRAESSGSASGYYRTLDLQANEYPWLNWSWKILQTLAAENPYLKTGDDFAARVYIVFPGRFFWQRRSIVYVWSDKLPVNTVIANAYTDRVAVIAIESGNRFAGSWRYESRNYVADYRACFHDEPDDPVAIAFMTDTDNTGSQAVAWYGDIFFSR
jgi:hypothetical protein